MKVIKISDLIGTDRDVHCPKGGFYSRRVLLESDNMGYTITETTIPVNGPQNWHYKDHLESCFCVKGFGKLTDLSSGKVFDITPGTCYILDKHDNHIFEAIEETVLICVFNPPLKGREVHKEDGSY